MQENGRLITCDRCGEKLFQRCVGKGEADGGYTRWNEFEEPPTGWGIVGVGTGRYVTLCPICHKAFETLTADFMSPVTPEQ